MEPWQKILGIIEFIIALIVLLFLIGVIAIITKNRNLEFNGYWKSRTLLASSAFVWVIFLMLGNEYLWSSIDGLFGMSKSQSSAVCSLHVFFTVGVAQPLFFLVCLFTIRSKTNRDKSNNNNDNSGSRSNYNPINRGKSFLKNRFSFEDPNDYVYLCSFICTLPLVVVHIILAILDATNVSEPNDKQVLFTAYDDEQQKCSVPIISTIAFAIFFVIFLIFFIFISRKFSKNIINKSLINRIRLLQISFIAFLPLEVAIKVVLKATSTIGYTSQALFNAFFFVDIIVILIGILEFALFPILDSLGFYSSSIRLWKFKLMYRSQSDEITNDGGGGDNFDKNEKVGGNILLTTMSTNVSSTTPNSLIPISDYEKSMKYNNNNGASTPNNNKDNKDNNNNNYNNNNNNNNNQVENYDDDFIQQKNQQQQSELEKLKIKHKSPILDRVRDTEPINLPVEPLSSPLSSVSSKSSHLDKDHQPIHERKKSRRFSLSSKKRSSSSSSTTSSSQTPISSPPSSSQPSSQTQNRYLQPTPVDDFKNNLFKYSNHHHGGYK